MATDVVVLDKEALTGILKDIAFQHLPHWLEEFGNGKTFTRSASKQKMSYEAFLEWADEDTLAEWVDGEVLMSSPASLGHQDLTDFLTSILRLFVEHHHLGIVISAPFHWSWRLFPRKASNGIAAPNLLNMKPEALPSTG